MSRLETHPALARLFLETLNDRTLIILMIAAVVNIALGMTTENIRCVRESVLPPYQRAHRTGWIDGTAILAAVLVVATVTAANDYSKERQFQELNRVVESRKGTLLHHSLVQPLTRLPSVCDAQLAPNSD